MCDDDLPEIECTACGWQGAGSELQCSEEDFASDKPTSDINFDRCPNCGGTDFEDYEDDD